MLAAAAALLLLLLLLLVHYLHLQYTGEYRIDLIKMGHRNIEQIRSHIEYILIGHVLTVWNDEKYVQTLYHSVLLQVRKARVGFVHNK